MTEIQELKKEIEEKIREFRMQTDKITSEAENALGQLAQKGYKIDKEKIEDFFKRFWHTYAKNSDEWEVAIPIFIPFNIGWFDRTEGGYNIFVINKYTKWLGEEIPAFILHETNLPPPLNITIDGKEITFDEEKQEKIEKLFGEHLTLIEKNKASVKQGHEFDLIAEIIDSGSLPFRPNPISEQDLMESDFTKIWDEMKEKYSSLEIFEGKYSYQGDAWKSFQKYGALGIFWAMSFGKTVIGTYIFSRIKGKKGLLVPTITLKEQWEEFFKRNCPRLSEKVEIYTYAGMSRKSWQELQKKEFTLMGFDECLTKGTTILKEDGGVANIEDIANGDEVIGGKTNNVFKRKTDKIVKIYSSFGELETTETHPHIIISKDRNMRENKWFKLNEKNIKTKLAYELREKKDFLLVPESIGHTQKNKWSAKQLSFVSLIMCDGHIDKNNNSVKVCVSKSGEKEWMREVFIEGIKAFGYDKFWEFTNKRGDYTIGCCNKKVKDILVKIFSITPGRKAAAIIISNEIFYAPKESIRKFIDIAFSCEGWINFNKKSNSRWIYFCCRSKRFTNNLKLLLKKFGIHSNYTIHKKINHDEQYQLQIGSEDFNKFKELIGLTHGNKNLKLIPNKIKYMNNHVEFNGKSYRAVRINKIEKIDKKEDVFDFETTSHNFLANGILTHNCHFLPADSFSKLATIKTKYRFGLSATPYREDGRTNYVMALTGYPIGRDWKNLMNVLGKEYHTINVHIVKDLESKFALIKQLYNPERRTLFFVNLINIGKRISEQMEIPFISGETKNRMQKIKESKSFVASRVLELGVSIKDLEHIIEVDFLFGSRREEVQRTGRLMHSEAEGKVHDIIMTKDELEHHGKRLYGLYEKGFRYKLIPHLLGVKSATEIKEKPRTKIMAKSDVNLVEKLFSEGYFVIERKFGDVVKEVEKRGGNVSRNSQLYKKLNSLVRKEKLFKIKMVDGYRFKQR